MVTKRIQRQIDRLFDEAEQTTVLRNLRRFGVSSERRELCRDHVVA